MSLCSTDIGELGQSSNDTDEIVAIPGADCELVDIVLFFA